jgi:hypothetical protein
MRPWSAHDRRVAAWAVRFLAFPRTDRGYAALFPEDTEMVRGELTPTYAVLPETPIQRLATMNPRLRIVYLVRNPVDRAWSDANMRAQKRRLRVDFATCGPVERDLLKRPSELAHSDYVGNLKRWKRLFPPDQIHVAFFDQLVEDPGGLLSGICRFLGVEDSDIRIPPDVGRPRNSRGNQQIPEPTFQFLARTLAPYVAEQHRYFDNEYTARWKASCAPSPVTDHGASSGP